VGKEEGRGRKGIGREGERRVIPPIYISGSAPDPAGGAYSARPDPLAGF